MSCRCQLFFSRGDNLHFSRYFCLSAIYRQDHGSVDLLDNSAAGVGGFTGDTCFQPRCNLERGGARKIRDPC